MTEFGRIDGLYPDLLPAYEKNVLTKLCEMLAPFEEVAKVAHKRENISSSLVIPSIRGLMRKIAFEITFLHYFTIAEAATPFSKLK